MKQNSPTYGSDLVVEMLKSYEIEYAALNPGATVRGIQDSIVNYGKNTKPELIECCHEEIAVAIAHGYAKAKGKPMAVVVHDVVGLLHASMAIFNAWCDNAPAIIIGGTGPLDTTRRRPWIDWVHTALVQADLVRSYVKWDDQPYSHHGIPESFIRAYRLAMTEPTGPVYLCYDVELQESQLGQRVDIASPSRYPLPSPIQASDDDLEKTAKMLVEAEMPVIVAEFLGRNPEAVERLVELAEALSAPVVDRPARMNFPNTHPLDLTGSDILAKADFILALDVKDLYGALTKTDRLTRTSQYVSKEATRIVRIGFHDIQVTKGVITDYQKLHPSDLSIVADTSSTLPKLTRICRKHISTSKEVLAERFATLKIIHDRLRNEWLETALREGGKRPISLAKLALEIWKVIKKEDWVLGAGSLGGRPGWERRIWEFTKPNQHFGHSWGAGLGYSLPASIGVALALKGKLCIDLQPDGDLLYTPSALWTATHHRIPLLVVMVNNRRYQNDWEHSYLLAESRDRSTEAAKIGNELSEPALDFAMLARSMGAEAIGTIEDPEEIQAALTEALAAVRTKKKLALVDLIVEAQ